MITLLLEGAGHAVRTAGDGAEALAIHVLRPVDVIVSDIRLPAMDGATMARILRDRGDRTPILLVSVMPPPTLLADGQFMRKPLDVAALVHAVEVLLAGCGETLAPVRDAGGERVPMNHVS